MWPSENGHVKNRLRSFSPQGLAGLQRGVQRAAETRRQQADTWAIALAPVVHEILKDGFQGLVALASELEARGCKTRRGGLWSAKLVGELCRRLQSKGLVPPLASASRYRPSKVGLRNREGVERSRAALRDNADDFARSLAPMITSLRAHGVLTHKSLADALNARNILPQRAARWTVPTIRHLCQRLQDMASRAKTDDATATSLPQK